MTTTTTTLAETRADMQAALDQLISAANLAQARLRDGGDMYAGNGGLTERAAEVDYLADRITDLNAEAPDTSEVAA